MALACFNSGSALAFRTAGELPEIQSEQPVGWVGDQVEFDVDVGATGTIELPARVETMARALGVWERAACGAFQLAVNGTTEQPGAPGDGRNTLTIITQGWGERGFAASDAAYTDVLYENEGDGWRISEADLYVNGVDFDWVASGATPTKGRLKSLEAVLAHEVGHALGLLHPCEIAPQQDEPKCGGDAGFKATMMYPLYDSTKLKLSEDDRAGLCAIYGCDASCPTEAETGAAGAGGSAGEGATESAAGMSGSDAPDDLGKACQSTLDCAAGVCLTGAESQPICSHPCVTDRCAESWYCEEVDAQKVCVPQGYEARGGSCTFLPRETSSGRLPWEWVVCLMMGVSLWRRREASGRW